MKVYYILWYRIDQRDGYLIWFSDQTDGVVVDGKKVATFDNIDDLKVFAVQKRLKLVDETPILHQFDTVISWLTDPNQELNSVDCMNAWNLIKDITHTLRLKFKGNLTDNLTMAVYDKICQNNTIPAFVPGAEGGKTNLKEKERRLLAEIMGQAINLARTFL